MRITTLHEAGRNLLTQTEAANRLNVSKTAIWHYIRDGRLTAIKTADGGGTLIPIHEIESWTGSAPSRTTNTKNTRTRTE